MEIEMIVALSTIIVTFLCGIIAKKITWFNNNLIPIQNILIGLFVALIEWSFTKDFSIAITVSGLIAGGTYDIAHNLQKIIGKKQK